MKYYPICLRVAGRPCLVIGGGYVAEQKVCSLLKAAAAVTVISPQLTHALEDLAAQRRITLHRRVYARDDLRGFSLVFAATNDDQLHEAIARDAAGAGVLLNVVDRPALCDFIVPSVMQQGDLLIATSTSGSSPAMAHRIRSDLEMAFGPEYALALDLLRRLRERLANDPWTSSDRHRIFTALVNSSLLQYLREHRSQDVDQLLATTIGEEISLASLGMDLN